MRLAALFSGGKDSTYAARLMELEGHEVQYLVSMRSKNPDSYMFHTVNIDITSLQAETWEKEYVSAETEGIKEQELIDLKTTLMELDIEGVITGAIASNYQQERIDKLCHELDLVHFSPLWGRNRVELLWEMHETGMSIIFSAVAAQGLDETWLGTSLDEVKIDRLEKLYSKYSVDPCGEGGEYESLVVDAPWFKQRIEVIDAQRTWDGVSGRYIIAEARLVPKY
ncbi:MAG: diphthine--ammonia ligase [Candidatus Bathyarchaeota archaeon]|nr:diphthine--ammonia ligase [Candidatus Bathyarchaeota archaeon]